VISIPQKIVIKNETVKVKGRVKAITIKKEEFDRFLKHIKLRVLDREYDALMPPLDDLQKNTIDLNGLAILVQQFNQFMTSNSGGASQATPAQIILTTQGGTVPLSYNRNISPNSQGVTVFIQVFQSNNNYTFQYFYIGFDTTNSSYTTSQLELYVSSTSTIFDPVYPTFYTDTVRIAYSNMSFTKTSDSFLFIVWLIEFQNIPQYLVPFVPILQNNAGILAEYPLLYFSEPYNLVFFNNGNCNFSCNGNCPWTYLTNFITYVQNNSVVLEFPITISLGNGVSNVEILLCTSMQYNNLPTISGSISTTISPPVSGATVYVAIATITIIFQGS